MKPSEFDISLSVESNGKKAAEMATLPNIDSNS